MTTALDLIRTKRDALVLKRDQMSAGVNVLAGAISVCEELIEQIACVSTETNPVPNPNASNSEVR
ncbi:hypothetical protein [Rhodopseudomonas sp. BR0G17]|uniref:hypothetical protein n=1 Tax=Rhodopseudomonas sp. BR0G17 TaxID=2269368 RepID=UPI0013DEBE59|nr:hypothetical protein [Rhodopseudomonas sp. BR0G17]NEW95489.1 hypothetical protein [Rhodopseudomonas sp. BR0G17]